MVKRGKEEIKVLTVGMEVGARRRIYFFFKISKSFFSVTTSLLFSVDEFVECAYMQVRASLHSRQFCNSAYAPITHILCVCVRV